MKKSNSESRIFVLILALSFLLSYLTPLGALAQTGAGDKTVYMITLPRASDGNYSKLGWRRGDLTFQFGWTSAEVATHRFEDAFSMESINGKAAYCIEPGIHLALYSKLHEAGDDYWENYPEELNPLLTNDQIKYLLSLVYYYGYTGNINENWDSTNTKHADQMGYSAATQILVHEIIVGERDKDFNHVNPPAGYDKVSDIVSSSNPIKDQIWKYYDKITADVKAHKTIPSFMVHDGETAPEFVLEWDGENYSKKLVDTNNVIGLFKLACSDPDVRFEVKGNTLTITSTHYSAPIEIKGFRDMKKMELVIYTDGEYRGSLQDLMTGFEMSETIECHVLLATDEGLAPVRVGKIGELLSGSHVTGAAEGVLIAADYTKGSIPGATFTVVAAEDIYATDGTTLIYARGDIADRITTKAGEDWASSKNLPVGKYQLVEVIAPVGFVIDPTPIPVEVKLGEDGEPIAVDGIAEDARQLFDIQAQKAFEKVNQSDTDPLPYGDVLFGLYARDAVRTSDGFVVFAAGAQIETFRLDSTGKALIKSDLPAGKYYIKELATAGAYRLLKGEIDFTASYSGADSTRTSIEVPVGTGPIVNALMAGGIRILKRYEGVDTPIAGVVFELEGTTIAGPKLKLTLVTDATGTAYVSDIPLGSYTLTETFSPLPGYRLITGYPIELTDDGVTITIELVNTQVLGSVRLKKVDSASGKTLKGAEFELFNPEGKSLGIFGTDASGIILVKDLPYGIGYRFIESKAPTGYVLSSKPIVFDISEHEVTVELTAKNTSDTNTGDDSRTALWFGLTMCSILGFAAVMIQANNRRRAY